MWEGKEDEEIDCRQMRGRRDLYQSELEIERGAQGIVQRRRWCKRTMYGVSDGINTVSIPLNGLVLFPAQIPGRPTYN